MMDAIGKMTISEITLLFVLLFVLPGMAGLLFRLREYESRSGDPRGSKKGKRREPPPPPPPADRVPDDVFPYRRRPFLSPPELACLAALREALAADEVDVFPKVGLWELVEPTDKNPGYAARLSALDFDFLVCERQTSQPIVAILFTPARDRPAGPAGLREKICKAAGIDAVFIDLEEKYEVKRLKEVLGIAEANL
ncbi:MAG: DUF2726 domain-containing protein [Planctomycetota bacterium]|jgi:hypothetical protein|nr:DUF2726 domain-containing protein [Planctomycetota bacterium]